MADRGRRSGGRRGTVQVCAKFLMTLMLAVVPVNLPRPSVGAEASDLDTTFGDGGVARLPRPTWTNGYCANPPLVDA